MAYPAATLDPRQPSSATHHPNTSDVSLYDAPDHRGNLSTASFNASNMSLAYAGERNGSSLPPYQPSLSWSPGDGARARKFTAEDAIDPESLTPEQLKVFKLFDTAIDREWADVPLLRSILMVIAKSPKMPMERFKKEQLKQKKFVEMFITLAVIAAIVCVFHFKEDIVEAIEPVGQDLTEMTFGWLIAVAFIVLLSIPPLVGAEILILVAGVIYPVYTAFGIASLGTLVGDSITFFMWTFMKKKWAKYSRKNLFYSQIARVVRDSGFLWLVLIRWSAVPSHITSSMFAMMGVGYLPFLGSVILSFPRSIPHVYDGYYFKLETEHAAETWHKVLFFVLTGGLIALTIVVMKKLSAKCDTVRPEEAHRLRTERARMLNDLELDSVKVEGGAAGGKVSARHGRNESRVALDPAGPQRW